MKPLWLISLLALSCLSGCSTLAATYAKAHPELSPAHRQILTEGKVPGGGAVEGMTHEQVRLAIGNPTTFEKINGEDAWVYVRSHFVDISPGREANSAYGSGFNSQKNFTETARLGERPKENEKMTIFFHGDRAAYAQIATR